MKKILSLLFLLSFFFLFTKDAFSDSNFATYYNVSYEVGESQNTKVTLDIELKNKTTDFYASSYSLQTGFSDIKNIKAADQLSSLEYKAQKNERGTLISLDFGKKVVGVGNIQKFSVSFETSEIAKNFGRIWEVNIPGVQRQEEFQSFNVKVVVPKNFGGPTIVKPAVKDLKVSGNSISFSKNDLGEAGISIAYGQVQLYKFNLKYHLQNKNLFPVVTEIAIPSNNNYQEVKIEQISPAPIEVYIDPDGNWLAKYRLLPSKSQDVLVKGVAKISHKGKMENLSEVQKTSYLKSNKYWEAENSDIKKLAQELGTAEKIYRYVVDNLTYDSSRVKDIQERAGALGVLGNRKSAVCLEFTDFFIAIARAAGIPARAVEGYANTTNSAQRPLSLVKDVLHSWPEFYDFEKRTWIMVDPTWENTTGGIDYFNVFDFDHFTFVIKGEDSNYPIPAGGYKTEESANTKDVEVTTTVDFDEVSPALTVSTNFSESYLGGLSIDGEIVLSNLSGVLSPNQTVKVSSKTLSPQSQNLYFDKIPPYGKRVVPLHFNPRGILTNEEDVVKITIGKEEIERRIYIFPFYKNVFFILGGFVLGSTTIALSIYIRRSRRLRLP